MPPITAAATHGFPWYERITGGIRLASGDGIAVEHYRHPDPVAESLRWQACEANVIQAIGRLRTLRREQAEMTGLGARGSWCARASPITIYDTSDGTTIFRTTTFSGETLRRTRRAQLRSE